MYPCYLCNGLVAWSLVFVILLQCNIGTLHVISLWVNFNEILVSFYWWNMTCMLTRCEYDKWSNWWRYVARMNYCASILLYEFKILSSNFSLAWLHNSSAISWHHPIITCCCNFADDSHSCWSGHQLRWQWWWLTTTAVTVDEWVFHTSSWGIREQ